MRVDNTKEIIRRRRGNQVVKMSRHVFLHYAVHYLEMLFPLRSKHVTLRIDFY